MLRLISGDTARVAPAALGFELVCPAEFPVLTINRITLKKEPIYHSTYTGKPPDEPAMLGLALNELFVPLL